MSEIQKAAKPPLAINSGGLVFDSIEALYRFCQYVEKSPLCPKGMNAETMVPLIQLGMELGMKPTQALRGIMVVNGRASVYGDTLKGLVEASPVCEWITEGIDGTGDSMAATCETKRRGRPETCVSTFSVADAKRAKLWGKPGPWTEYPQRMLQMRARGFCLRDAYPDVILGLGMVEEVRDIPADSGDIDQGETKSQKIKRRLGLKTANELPSPESVSEELAPVQEQPKEPPNQEPANA